MFVFANEAWDLIAVHFESLSGDQFSWRGRNIPKLQRLRTDTYATRL